MNRADPKALRSNALFAGLPEQQLDMIATGSRVSSHPRGKVIFVQGDPAPHFFLVLEGWVTIYRSNPEGEHTILNVVRKGETFAEAAALNLKRYPASAEAVTDCRLLEIPATALTEILRADPETALRVIGLLCQRLHRMVSEIERLNVRSAPKRLAGFLVELASAEADTTTVELPYDKSLVAARLGMKPESLSRALARLRNIGVTSRGARVEIENLAELRAFCEG